MSGHFPHSFKRQDPMRLLRGECVWRILWTHLDEVGCPTVRVGDYKARWGGCQLSCRYCPIPGDFGLTTASPCCASSHCSICRHNFSYSPYPANLVRLLTLPLLLTPGVFWLQRWVPFNFPLAFLLDPRAMSEYAASPILWLSDHSPENIAWCLWRNQTSWHL